MPSAHRLVLIRLPVGYLFALVKNMTNSLIKHGYTFLTALALSICLTGVSTAQASTYLSPRVERSFFPSLAGTNEYLLTFDDGPSKFTPQVLDVLKRNNVKAIFFVMGNKITSANLPIFRRIVNEGHVLGLHNFAHESANSLNEEEFKKLFRAGLERFLWVSKQLNYRPQNIYFRFPYGHTKLASGNSTTAINDISTQVLGSKCVKVIDWDITAYDWLSSQTAPSIYENILFEMNHSKRGGPILLHDGISLEELADKPEGLRSISQIKNTVSAVKLLLQNASVQGIEFIGSDQVQELQNPSTSCRY